MSQSVLSCRELRVRYGARTVLDNVALDVRSAEFVALVGPNGAGKTTLLEHLAGVRRAAHGTVQLAERALHHLTASERAKRLALLGRESSGELSLSVRSVVELGRLPHLRGFRLSSADHAIVERCLAEQDCSHLSERLVYSLSDGERQRVQWARALCQQSSVLLLDEATAHLDLAHREASFARARSFARSGGAVLAVAHDLDLAVRHATRVVVLHQGRIVADDNPLRALSSDVLAEVFGVDAAVVENDRGSALYVYGPYLASSSPASTV